MTSYVELYLDQGATFNYVRRIADDVTGLSMNLVNHTARSQLRRSYYSANASASFTCSVSSPANGEITLSLTANQTSQLKAGRYLFDVEVQAANNHVTRVLEGLVTVTPEITR